MKTAKFIKDSSINNNAKLYELSEPLASYGGISSKFVVVSAVIAFGEPETHIFPAHENGSVLDWIESPGSFRGELSHEKALERAGYKVIL